MKCESCRKDGIEVESTHHYHGMELCPWHYYLEREKVNSKPHMWEKEIRFFKHHHPRYTERLREQYPRFDKIMTSIEGEGSE